MFSNIVQKIKKMKWEKNWEGRFSLISTYMGVKGYFKPIVRLFSSDFKNVLIIHKKGVTSCYLIKSELKKFGVHLIRRTRRNPKLIEKWVECLKETTDEIYKQMKLPIAILLRNEEFQLFNQIVRKFSSYQIVLKELTNHLPPLLSKRYNQPIENARRYSEKVFFDLDNFTLKLAKFIARKKRYKTSELACLSDKEIENYVEGGNLPSINELESRYKTSGFFASQQKTIKLSEKDIRIIEEYWQKEAKKMPIRGQTAYKGKAIGNCRIVIDFKKANRFHDNEILVTGMTDPNFIPLIKKAAAIVTDAGGMLCHAAIVAREMKIPCVIGTKIATQVLKDGNLVEVDANRGIVKILKRK